MTIHPLPVRLTHRINAGAMTLMISSGWHIYNAAPFLPFRLPELLTLVGWLGGALGGYEAVRRVHFLAMTGIVLFVAVHPSLVAIVPRTLRPMITGGPDEPAAATSATTDSAGVKNA